MTAAKWKGIARLIRNNDVENSTGSLAPGGYKNHDCIINGVMFLTLLRSLEVPNKAFTVSSISWFIHLLLIKT